MRAAVPLLAVLLPLAGCGHSPPSVTLTLDPVAPAEAAVRGGYRGLPIAVPAVHVPAAIDRAEFVSQAEAGTLKVDDFARWSAPLGVLARDALVRDLTARLPAGSVLPPGATGTVGKAIALDVTILSFDPRAGGATMQVAWRPLPGGAVRQLALVTDGAADPTGAARSFAALLGQLADRIAADVGGAAG
ncbi:PqiC family protein [Sphingomonas sp.]|uniref:PqiC family protein n=1 Tax=Sphingomonas sp. TaxID=28214 RepID=UPI003AFF76D3